MSYTVKQLASMAGISNRTLHYYDQIGLLPPASYGENGYRYYDEGAVLCLQQIMFYRELGLSLDQIHKVIHRPGFNLIEALADHRKELVQRLERTQTLIATVDRTIQHLQGEITMTKQDFYQGFDEARQKEYAREAERRWGEPAAAGQKRWEAFSREEKNEFLSRMHEISNGFVDTMDKGYDHPDVQAWVDRWYRFLNQECFPCTLEVFENLGHMYVQDERFTATYENLRTGMAAFMDQAMTYYCQQHRE